MPIKPHHVMGLTMPNRVGVAAGLDKNADYVDALFALGFGFVEIGTVTPKPQGGHPRPRLFRLVKEEALINHMGLNNKGMDYVAMQLEKRQQTGVLGINIGKNTATSTERAVEDYQACFRTLGKWASYVVINISSPNMKGLRDLQQADLLRDLLQTMKGEQQQLLNTQQKYVPLVVKLSPDLSETDIAAIATVLLELHIDGVIATNTTLHRQGVEQSPYATKPGGLSGKPLHQTAVHLIQTLHTHLQQHIPIIASGGIMDEQSAAQSLAAGAELLQLYTGLIYQGPALIKRLS